MPVSTSKIMGLLPNIKMNNISKVKGFTLIELMIVIVILAIIASFAIPAYGNYVKRAHKLSLKSKHVFFSELV